MVSEGVDALFPPMDEVVADHWLQLERTKGDAMALDYYLRGRRSTHLDIVNPELSPDPSWDDGVRMMRNRLQLDGGHLLEGTVVLSHLPWAFAELHDSILQETLGGRAQQSPPLR